MDSRTPVLVGAGQLNHSAVPSPEPIELLATAVRRAGSDSGSGRLLSAIDSVRIVRVVSHRYRHPAALLVERLGLPRRHGVTTSDGGHMPQLLVQQAVDDIQAGRHDVVLIGGADTWRTRQAYRRLGERPPWPVQPDTVPLAETVGGPLAMSTDAETAAGLTMPVEAYPLFENALRAHAGRDIATHQRSIAALWSRFADVARGNPHAALRRAFDPDTIATPSDSNRLTGWPYTKLMTSNPHVDQAAAVILCSVERARALGVPEDRWVFVHSAAAGNDTHMSYRPSLASSPVIRRVGRTALELAGVGVDDLAHVDLYSCFPSAVQIAAHELGLPLERPLTVTGGLTFAGGPWNNYVTHSLATMINRLRDAPGTYGLCSANGGFLTKHAFGVYSTTPPSGRARTADLQAELDGLPRRRAAEPDCGTVSVETYVVIFGRDGGPERAVFACLRPDGARVWGHSRDRHLLDTITKDDAHGRPGRMAADGTVAL